jgi:hypothetical protein
MVGIGPVSAVKMGVAVALTTALCVVSMGPDAGASTSTLSTSVGVAGCSGGGVCVADVPFGDVTLGTYSNWDPTRYEAAGFYLNNGGSSTVTVDLSKGVSLSGAGADDYVLIPPAAPNCYIVGNTITLTAGYSCFMNVDFYPGRIGDRSATMTITASDGSRAQVKLMGSGSIGYYQVDEYGDVANYGDAAYYGDTGSSTLNFPIVGMAATGDNGGYWLVASDGGIFNFGDSAGFFGSAGGIHLNQPIVGMAPTVDNQGYWLVASDGGIFAYGDATFYGSTGAIQLNEPIVGMASTPDGKGYWLVASDGGIFAFGDAAFYGSTGAIQLNEPITSMAAMPDGGGYWFSAADGGLFNYGSAPFQGSGANDSNLDFVVGMTTDGSAPIQTLSHLPALRARNLVHAHARLEVPHVASATRRSS